MITLVGNKIDLENRQVSQQEAEDYAKEHGLQFFEVSAKQNIGIDAVFRNVAKLLPSENISKKKENLSLNNQDKQEEAGSGCYC